MNTPSKREKRQMTEDELLSEVSRGHSYAPKSKISSYSHHQSLNNTRGFKTYYPKEYNPTKQYNDGRAVSRKKRYQKELSTCDSARKRKEIKQSYENKSKSKRALIHESKSRMLQFDRFNEKVETKSTISRRSKGTAQKLKRDGSKLQFGRALSQKE